jgi:putative ABC transport system permease protein
MRTLLKDLRYGARMLAKNPGFTFVAVASLALGIGANTAIFSVVNAVLLRPLPYPEADRLVWMAERHEQIPTRWVSYPNFLDWRERSKSFEAMSTIRGWQLTLTGSGEAQAVNARMVTSDYFRVMRSFPLLGRDFSSEVDKYGAERVTILSHTFWQTQFGGDPRIVGKTITLDDQPFKVAGVMGPDFRHQGPPSLWVLVEQIAEPGGAWFRNRDTRTAGFVIARLKEGVSLEQARSEMKSIEGELISEYPIQNGGNTIQLVTLQESIVGDTRYVLLLLFVAVGVVLLITCANTANLLLVRATSRQKEFAIRAAMGAGRGRLLGQLLVESVLLSTLGGALGVLLASWGVDLLVQFAPENIPRLAGVTVDRRVLGFALALSVTTGLVFGIAPAWQSARVNLCQTLKEGGRGASDARGTRLRNALVIGEFALAVVLLAGAGLLTRSMARMLGSDPGFVAQNVVTMRLLQRQAYPTNAGLTQFHSQLLERIRSLPGVEAASLLNELPGFEPGWQTDINPEINGRYQKLGPGELINVDWGIVTADYFKTMRIRIKQGRTFTDEEVARGAPVLLVDEQLAERFWPGGDAVGKHIKYDSPAPIEIIGVVGNVRNYDSEALGRVKIYTPMGRGPLPLVTLAVRTTDVDPTNLIAAIKNTVQAINLNVPVYEISTLDSQLDLHIAPRRFNTWLLGLFAAAATMLAASGIYGVMSYAVTERTRELGIRLALGAQKRHVLRLMMARTLRLVFAGLASGLLASLLLTRWLRHMLFGVSATDPVTFAVISVLLVGVAMLACYLPARRAAALDPLVALRYE